MRLALFAGTFDPITLGHLDILQQALQIFDHVEVTVGVNAAKSTLFSPEARCEMIRALTQHDPRVSVATFEGLLVHYAQARGAIALIRGIRQVSDYDYELRMAVANRRLAPEISTVIFMPNEDQAITSSSIVREIWRWGGDVSSFVPASVVEALHRLKAK